MPKKGGKKAKKGARKHDGPLGPAAAGEAFAAATAKALTDESGGEDGVDLEAVGGADGMAELVRDEVEAAAKAGAAGGCVWELAPDAAELIRDAGASDAVMESVSQVVGSGLAAFVTALTTGPQYEPGAACEAVMPKDLQWHDAAIVSYDEDARLVRVVFAQFANLEAELACDHVRMPDRELGDGDGACPLCGREMPVGPYHLFPQSQHARLKKKGTPAKELEAIVLMCAPCRSACKGADDDATMAAKFSTLDLLQAHPKIQEFAKYAAKQKTTVGMAGAYST